MKNTRLLLREFKTLPIRKMKVENCDEIRAVKIEESGERLVPINTFPERIINQPEYFIQGIKGALPVGYMREGAYKRLLRAASMLPKGFRLLVFDAWRPASVQMELYNRVKDMLKLKNPNASCGEISELAEEFIAFPSENETEPPPHGTGGAVDLTIVDSFGIPLNMGTEFDEIAENTPTRFYEEKAEKGERLSETEKEILENRRLLFNIMESAGFRNYAGEWWHYDYGNQRWAWCTGRGTVAFYGRAKPKFTWLKDIL
ncbi:MAG: M15 family metallopeptidase [Caldisericaceae bacterium]|nr:M15 family metallopeptidase [Caldisericaceae bacterium]